LFHGHLQANRILLTAQGVVKIAGFGEPDWLVPGQKSEVRSQGSGVRDQESGVRSQESEVMIAAGDHSPETSNLSSLTSADLADLCRIAAAWAAPSAKKKGTRAKPFPKPLRKILDRLKAEDAETRYATAAALLADLDEAADHVSDNPEAWDKLLSHIRDQGKEETPLKQSA
jgi:hypothetical protein